MTMFIVNSYQTPNVYVDMVLALLSPSEWVVLSYAMRRTYGFNKRSDRISLSQFAEGLETADGRRLDRGTGLSIPTIRAALRELVRYGLMRKVAGEEPNATTGEAQGWELNYDEATIDLAGLEARDTNSAAQHAARAAAKAAAEQAGAALAEGVEDGLITPKDSAILTKQRGQQDMVTPAVDAGAFSHGAPTPPPPTDDMTALAEQGKGKKRSTAKRGPAPYMDHPGVQAFRDLIKRTPAEPVRAMIAQQVSATDPKELAAWSEAVVDCLASGCNPTNIKYMLTVFQAGGYDAYLKQRQAATQTQRDRQRSATARTQVEGLEDVTEAQRARMERLEAQQPPTAPSPRRTAPRVPGFRRPGETD